MEMYLSLLIPAIAIITRFYFIQSWKAPLLLVISVIGVPFIFESCSISGQTKANEILGGWVEDATYYEPWDEYISQTCTREVNCTTDKNGYRSCQTETYDCSYVQYHPEEYVASTTLGDIHISKPRYDELVKQFNNSKFIDMHRDYDHIDGDACQTIWKGDSTSFEPYFINHSYENRIQASNSVFNYKEVDTTRYKLFKQGRADRNGNAHSFYVEGGYAINGDSVLNYYNGFYGNMKQLRMIVLVFKNKPLEYGIQQESYWKQGNKNEFITCIGINDSGIITWVHPFSWTQKKELLFNVRDAIMDMGKFNDVTVANYLGKTVVKGFVRKEFKDFEYIEVHATPNAVKWCWIVVIALTAIWLVFGIFIDSLF